MLRAQDASMADEQVHLQGQLFHELKKRFPEVPDSVVSTLMQQNGFIRERCIDALGRESNKYLNNGPLPLQHLHVGVSLSDGQNNVVSGQVLSGKRIPSDNSGRLPTSSTVPSNISKLTSGDIPSSTGDLQFTSTKTFYVGAPGNGAGDAQNGPYVAYDPSSSGQMPGASTGVWLGYPLHGQTGLQTSDYQHGAVSRGGGTQLQYPPQVQSSGPASIPPLSQPQYMQRWPYDPNHRTPPHQRGPPQSFPQRFPPPGPGYRTPSPQQHYPLYPFDYPQAFHYHGSSPGSPSSAGSLASGGYPPQGPQSFNPNMAHPSATTTTTSPSSSGSNLWYMTPNQHPSKGQGSGSNASTPTRSPFPVFPGSPWQHGYPTLDSEHLHHVHPNQTSVHMEGRRGSEDTGYTQALLLHQQARMDKLRLDLENSLITLEKLRGENMEMERESDERRNQRSSSFPTAEDVGKMREENRRLLIDIQLMTREIDMFNNGQVLLGVIDPQEQQSFYKNIGSTGQRGSIHAGGEECNDRLPIEEEGMAARVPPARPPPPLVSGGSRREAPITPPDPSPDPDEGENWSCSACTFLNHPALDRCECCEMPRLNTSNPTGFS